MFMGEKNTQPVQKGMSYKHVTLPIPCIKNYSHSPITSHHPALNYVPLLQNAQGWESLHC